MLGSKLSSWFSDVGRSFPSQTYLQAGLQFMTCALQTVLNFRDDCWNLKIGVGPRLSPWYLCDHGPFQRINLSFGKWEVCPIRLAKHCDNEYVNTHHWLYYRKCKYTQQPHNQYCLQKCFIWALNPQSNIPSCTRNDVMNRQIVECGVGPGSESRAPASFSSPKSHLTNKEEWDESSS